MRLLVSVRCGAEVPAALEGGADIVDAKEPAHGSLGAVDAGVLSGIAEALEARVPLSVALGDVRDAESVAMAVETLFPRGRVPVRYLKLGFAGVEHPGTVGSTLAAAVAAAAGLEGHPQVVAVAYADHGLATSLPPATLARLAADAGAAGVLLDTWTKDGRDLFAWCSAAALQDWVTGVRETGLLTGVAGSLRSDSIATAIRAQPDIVGVRGAACEGGRSGPVSPARVRALRWAIHSTGVAAMA